MERGKEKKKKRKALISTIDWKLKASDNLSFKPNTIQRREYKFQRKQQENREIEPLQTVMKYKNMLTSYHYTAQRSVQQVKLQNSRTTQTEPNTLKSTHPTSQSYHIYAYEQQIHTIQQRKLEDDSQQ